MITKNLWVVMLILTGLGCTSPTGVSSNDDVEARSALGALEKQESQGSTERGANSSRGLVTNIEKLTEQNNDFRHVVYTAKHSQLVVMALPPGEHIGAETHRDVDQFFRVEEGSGEVMLGSDRRPIGPGSAIVVPAGTKHDVTSTGDKPLKLYTIYSPPQHRDGVVHHTRADAERDTEHFDGRTTE
ncbi:MAG TPA: cupin domain-containing protein [Labilithrix sp.]|nr:cupin domain-containing protein [Labilithrix sp.]